MKRIAILGGGSWGTALAIVLSRTNKPHEIALWVRDAALAERIGAVRIAPFGTMQDPPLAGHHGGSPRIADFVRWIDRE